jgi:hypothetical protein
MDENNSFGFSITTTFQFLTEGVKHDNIIYPTLRYLYISLNTQKPEIKYSPVDSQSSATERQNCRNHRQQMYMHHQLLQLQATCILYIMSENRQAKTANGHPPMMMSVCGFA